MAPFAVFANALLLQLAWTSLQAAVLISLVWLLCRLVPRMPATVRCALWWLVAAQLIVGLIWQAPVRLPVLQPTPVSAVVIHAPVGSSTVAILMRRSAVSATAPAVFATRTGQASADAAPLSWREVLAGLWLAGLLVQLVVMAVQWQRARRLYGASRIPSDTGLQALCQRQALQLGLRACPEMRICDGIDSPQVMGLWHRVVLWPSRHRLAPNERALAMTHELAHLQRGDLWLVWAPVLARWLFFFHPLVHLAVREYGLNREAACDSRALQLQRAVPDAYGRLLLALGIEHPLSAGLTGMASPSFRQLKRRLVMLEQASLRPRTWQWLLVAVVALACVVPYRAVAASRRSAPTSGQPAVLTDFSASPHSGAHLSVDQINGRGSLRWRDGRDALVLHSDTTRGVHVTDVQPAGLFGLHKSDVILDVNGEAADTVSTFLDRLRITNPAPAKVRLRHDGSAVIITLAASQYGRLIPPPPPAPPSPPAPPAPPPPPPPPGSSTASPITALGSHNTARNVSCKAGVVADGVHLCGSRLVVMASEKGDDTVLFDHGTIIVNGDFADINQASHFYRPDTNLLWFRRDDRDYVVRDNTTLQRANVLVTSEFRTISKQDSLSTAEGKLAERQGALAQEQGRLAQRQEMLVAEGAKLQSLSESSGDRSAVADWQAALRSQIATLQSEVDAKQSPIDTLQHQINALQRLAREHQSKVATSQRKFAADLVSLANEALNRGVAEEVATR